MVISITPGKRLPLLTLFDLIKREKSFSKAMVQLNMLRQLAKLYNVSFFDHLGKTIVSAIAGGSAARLGASLVKAIPGVGTIIGELSQNEPVPQNESDAAIDKIKKLADMKDTGILSEEEFKQLKERLIGQI